MKKYWRWIVFGLVAAGLIVVLLLVGANANMRQQIMTLLTEKLVRNKVRDLEDKAAVAKAKADAGTITALEAERVAKEADVAIARQKEDLQKKLENQGLGADEISNRFNKLSI